MPLHDALSINSLQQRSQFYQILLFAPLYGKMNEASN